MKKLLLLFLMMCSSFELYAIDLNGKYISQSGELLFRFTADSLYIDIAQSQRNISAFKLVRNTEDKKGTSYNAYESYIENGRVTYRDITWIMKKLGVQGRVNAGLILCGG